MLGRELTPQEAQIVSSEGYNAGSYIDTKGVPTTGFGQTGEYSGIPFDQVVNSFEQKTRGIVPSYDTLPQELQLRLLDSTYRGGLSGSPATLKLLNSGQWESAADEFLDNDEYRTAVKSKSGVASRMEETAEAMRQYGYNLAVSKAQQQVPQQEAPPQVDAGFLDPVNDFINSIFGGDESGKPKKEITDKIPPKTKETFQSFWDIIFGD
jgi:GH24 family phage-related lysozyme (muramidase)